jgi:hypothetical protein
MRIPVLVLSMLWLLADVASPAVIATCGEDVPSGEDAVLIADLSCGTTGIGVHLGSNVRLRLNGHSIQGGSIGVYTHVGYTEIEGPGVIAGAAQVGIYAPNNEGRHRMVVRGGVELTGHGLAAIALGQANRVRLKLEEVNIHDNAGSGVADCSGLKVTAWDLHVDNNGAGGICADKISLYRSSVSNNGSIGLFSWRGRVRLFDSIASGNDPTNGWDVATGKRPRLHGTSTCGRSVVVEFPEPLDPGDPSWGVCAGD